MRAFAISITLALAGASAGCGGEAGPSGVKTVRTTKLQEITMRTASAYPAVIPRLSDQDIAPSETSRESQAMGRRNTATGPRAGVNSRNAKPSATPVAAVRKKSNRRPDSMYALNASLARPFVSIQSARSLAFTVANLSDRAPIFKG